MEVGNSTTKTATSSGSHHEQGTTKGEEEENEVASSPVAAIALERGSDGGGAVEEEEKEGEGNGMEKTEVHDVTNTMEPKAQNGRDGNTGRDRNNIPNQSLSFIYVTLPSAEQQPPFPPKMNFQHHPPLL